jgi:hypothetical protein
MTNLRSIPDYPELSVRRVNRLEREAMASAKHFAEWYKSMPEHFPMGESSIPGMCANICEATFTRSKDKKIVSEQIGYVRKCAVRWCEIYLKCGE